MRSGVISLGEALIDFIPLDKQNNHYQKSPGGAPANVAVGISRLGLKSTFLGKVGDDVLGKFLYETLENHHVRVNQMVFTSEHKTGVVFVTNAEDGERSFDFYINPSADRFLESKEIDKEDFVNHKIFHFGSISMISDSSKEATKYGVELAKKNNMIVSYDPNLRLDLWDSEKTARETIKSMINFADILKISEEELTFITGEKEIVRGIEVMKSYDIPLLIVTMGALGSYVCTSDGYEHVPALKVDAVDTTGAGDAFVSGILYSINEYDGDIRTLSLEKAVEMARFASISGALAASTKGAMTALPTLEQIKMLLAKVGGNVE
ncbi:aminoimidazole riboside kinase [Metabacillus litoralis]|uniref:aminoimidazole riboside kinase n=1 Tax=Metabacillus litoralis TaxID=152268 RepID=UPI000EF58B1E|nr:aminoimidazole riboside kinase [Metabacillus litoralis]